MMSNKLDFPFRLGATSYIIEDDILPNVRYLADKVQDIELVLFEVDPTYHNLPSDTVVEELLSLAAENDLTYTVHLPLDLKLGAENEVQDISLEKAQRVIECTRSLNPWAYVLHLDGREVKDNPDDIALARWRLRAARALEIVAAWAGGFSKLAVENLEGYPLDFIQPVLSQVPAGRCIDIGHLWLEGHDPLPYLDANLGQARVIHLHGIDGRDHRSLASAPPAHLAAVIERLCAKSYQGVVTIEVFNERDFLTSLEALSPLQDKFK